MPPKEKWDFWAGCVARFARAKARSGRSAADIRDYFEKLSGRKAGRAQINHWFTGRRQPTINQFMALCYLMDTDFVYILLGPRYLKRYLRRHSEEEITTNKRVHRFEGAGPTQQFQ